jgi:hypothetical protein
LITADNPVCAECGWSVSAGIAPDSSRAEGYAGHLKVLTSFSAAMFLAALFLSFSVTHGNKLSAALAGGLFAAGLIADLFLLRLIYVAAGLYREAARWTVGAVLTFPFGTLVFAWLLARRLGLEKDFSGPA